MPWKNDNAIQFPMHQTYHTVENLTTLHPNPLPRQSDCGLTSGVHALPNSGCSVQVDADLVDKLAYYLWFAEYAYEAGTEPNLKEVLTTRGELLLFQLCMGPSLHYSDFACMFAFTAPGVTEVPGPLLVPAICAVVMANTMRACL